MPRQRPPVKKPTILMIEGFKSFDSKSAQKAMEKTNQGKDRNKGAVTRFTFLNPDKKTKVSGGERYAFREGFSDEAAARKRHEMHGDIAHERSRRRRSKK
jgi:hypothetical protein